MNITEHLKLLGRRTKLNIAETVRTKFDIYVFITSTS